MLVESPLPGFLGRGWGREGGGEGNQQSYSNPKTPSRRRGSARRLPFAHVGCTHNGPYLFPFSHPPGLNCFGITLASLYEPPGRVRGNNVKLPAETHSSLSTSLHPFSVLPTPRPFQPSSTVSAPSLHCSAPPSPAALPLHPASSPYPCPFPLLPNLSPTPRRCPSQALPITPCVPSTDRGQALRTPCAAQGYRKARPLQRRNTGRGTQAANPPLQGCGKGANLTGRGSSLPVGSWKGALDQGGLGAWGGGVLICFVTLDRY